jgi:hypothetical protein
MEKKLLRVLVAIAFGLATTAAALGQTVTKTVQNPDGTYSIIEYPVKKEVIVDLTPVTIKGAKGVATVLRDDDGTRIKLNLTNVPADVTSLNLYAIDDTGVVTSLGPVAISDGVGTLATTTPLTKFMLVASPEGEMTTYDPNTKIFFRSAVPQGYAVIPLTSARGEKVAAVTTRGNTQATSSRVPMLNIPSYKTGDDTKIKVDFRGEMSGAKANVFITPHKDGRTEVKMHFHDLKDAPAGKQFVLWAISPDNQYTKLGQIVSSGHNEAEIKSETSLPDFGLMVTLEDPTAITPVGEAIGNIRIVP